MCEIDVSKCRYNYTSITNDSCCYAESGPVCMRKCNDYPNCYYKQLQRLKQKVRKLINNYNGCEDKYDCTICEYNNGKCEHGRNITDMLEILNNE